MPFIFRYKEFVIRFWYSFEERLRHVHAVSDDANVKICWNRRFRSRP